MPQVGKKRMRFINFGFEAAGSPGTPVPATTRWRGSGSIDDARTYENEEEDIGIFGGADRDYISKLAGTVSLESTSATFEQLQYLLALGMGGPRAGVKDGTGSGYIYTTPIPSTQTPAEHYVTVEGGDDFEAEQVPYCFCTKFSLTGTTGQPVKIDGAELMGRDVIPMDGADGRPQRTPNVPVPAVESILTSLGRVYLDDVENTFATTPVSNTILGFKVDFTFSWQPNYTMDGRLDFSYPTLTDVMVAGDLTMKHNAASGGAQGEKRRWRRRVPRLLAIRIPGSPLATAGTAFQRKELQLDLPIKWRKFNALGDTNGESTITGSWESRYNETLGGRGQVRIVNALAQLP